MNRPSSARPVTAAGRGRPPAAAGGGRPTTSFGRPSSAMGKPAHDPAAGRLGTAAQGRVGTAQRNGMPPRPGTTRLGTSAGHAGIGGLGNRPITQQGLQGVRPTTASRGARQIQDKTYFMGLLRAKITELVAEVGRLSAEIEKHTNENQNQLIYEKKAETLALEIRGLQGELADYNMLVDKMTINSDFAEMQAEYQELKSINEVESKAVDQLFAERRQKEEEVKLLELELENERQAADTMMTNIDNRARDRFDELRRQHQQSVEELQLNESELQELSMKKLELEEDLAVSSIKQEAMLLHEHLNQLESQRDAILAEVNAEGTPEQQREKLLGKVKQDNQEILTMERQITEAKERIEQIQIESRELDQDFEDQQGEKNQKYRELREKEQQMDEFLDSFEDNKNSEVEKIQQLETNIVSYLSRMSKNLPKYDSSPDATEIKSETESKPNSDPATELARLQQDMQKLEANEMKLKEEQIVLLEKIEKLSEDLRVFSNLDQLRTDVEQKKEKLVEEKEVLSSRSEDVKEKARILQHEVDEQRRLLNDNEIATQILNLEKKLQHVEQNNFALNEMIETRNAETNTAPVKEAVLQLVAEYNQLLIQTLANAPINAPIRNVSA